MRAKCPIGRLKIRDKRLNRPRASGACRGLVLARYDAAVRKARADGTLPRIVAKCI
ncbi:hypothetical protein [Azospirillum griseum]|uniref:hypothetical protein n=1 Tax=Azospirillum griseum TaxID=2496639 RepID=UPI0013156DF0|nr:hypothetical protein [Azospirillum griseum]